MNSRPRKRDRRGYQGAAMSGYIEKTDEGLFYHINWFDETSDRILLRRFKPNT